MKGVYSYMKKYNTMEIASLLNVNTETVRRWVRSGRLKSTRTSKKNGNLIDERDLLEFIKEKPKYKAMLNRLELQIDDTYVEKLNELLNRLIKERDRLNEHIDKIQEMYELGAKDCKNKMSMLKKYIDN